MSAQVTKEMIYRALENVMDPELNHNVVELGFIQEIDIVDDLVYIDIQLTTPHCPFADQILTSVRDAVTAVPGVREVDVRRLCEEEA